MALIVVQGALRKWFLPGLATPLYIAKDVALLGALALLSDRRTLRLTAPLRRSLLPVLWGGFAAVVVIQAFNLNVPSLSVGILGIRSYLLYSTLLVILPEALQQVQRPKRLLLVISVTLIVPVLLLGMYQYWQPPGSWINQYVADEAQAVSVLSRPRITGTFSYIGGMGTFLTFAVFFGLGIFLAGLHYKDRFYQILGGGVLGLALVVAPMNGSRSVVLGPLVPFPFVLYALLRRRRGLAVAISLLLLAGGGAYVASESGVGTEGWETIEYRMEKASDQGTRIQSMLLDPVRKVSVGGLVGYGTGSTHQAAGALSASGRVQIEGVGYEGELGRVLIELGIFGTLLFLALKAWLAWIGWQALRRASTVWTTALSVMAFCKLFLNLGVGMIVFNHISGALYWICAGCAVWVWSRQEVQKGALSRSPTKA
ncbi:hypothetical protein [Salinibacter ruber]|uniref:hypothetical protein n=1 Tax=Salinibacter ruber TaxID=146919 RepID=UPI002074730A|nr:hypothetical protein [Salinibacter ruber]